MSKMLKITIYTNKGIKCSAASVIGLLKGAGFDIEDKEGGVHFFGSLCSWEKSAYSDDLISIIDKEGYLFRAFGEDGHMLKVSVQDPSSFSVWPAGSAKTEEADGEEFFDFNWYYRELIHPLNKDGDVVERVIFEQY